MMEYLLIGEIIFIIEMVIDLIMYREKSLLMSGQNEDLVDYLFELIVISGLYMIAWPIMLIGNVIYIVNNMRESN